MTTPTWILGVQHNGRIGHCQTIVLDVYLVSRGQLRVVEDLILSPAHVSDSVLDLNYNDI